MTWEKESETSFVQKGSRWFDRAEIKVDGIEFTTSELRGNTYVVVPSINVVRELLKAWDDRFGRESPYREQVGDSGVAGIDEGDEPPP